MTSAPHYPSLFLPDLIASPKRTAPMAEAERAHDSDGELVRRARAGERRAEELLYRRHVQYVQGLLVRLLVNRAEAEDAVQETFVIALDQLGSLRETDAFRGWLAQIAVSRARRRFRRKKLLQVLGFASGDGDAAVDLAPGPNASASVRAEMATLGQLLGRLATEERLAWSLRHLEGDSLDEVAAHCGCSLATAKRRIALADAFIRDAFGEREEAS
jgi:RNA polymerase sigma-70 factor (ECF subfamily)